MAGSTAEIKGLNSLLNKLERMNKFFNGSVPLMREIGLFENVQNKLRTSAGKNYLGVQFKPYSPGYKKVRQKAGHPVNKVNLLFSGKMLASQTHKVISPREVRVLFATPEETKKAAANQTTRKFFGISPKDEIGIKRIYRTHLEKIVNE